MDQVLKLIILINSWWDADVWSNASQMWEIWIVLPAATPQKQKWCKHLHGETCVCALQIKFIDLLNLSTLQQAWSGSNVGNLYVFFYTSNYQHVETEVYLLLSEDRCWVWEWQTHIWGITLALCHVFLCARCKIELIFEEEKNSSKQQLIHIDSLDHICTAHWVRSLSFKKKKLAPNTLDTVISSRCADVCMFLHRDFALCYAPWGISGCEGKKSQSRTRPWWRFVFMLLPFMCVSYSSESMMYYLILHALWELCYEVCLFLCFQCLWTHDRIQYEHLKQLDVRG